MIVTAVPSTPSTTAETADEQSWRLPGRSRLSLPVWRVRHRWVTTVLLVHLPALLVWALLHHTSTDTLLTLGAPAALYLAAAMDTLSRGRLPLPPVLASCAAAAGLMACSSFLVAVSGGYIEAHFHFFVMIPIVALYEDWAPFAIAAGIVLLEHGVVGTLWPHKVYGHAAMHSEHPWLFAAIHAGFVVAACVGSLTAWTLSERARTAQEQLLRQLHHRTRHDDLTGLANRTGLTEALDAALATTLATGTPVSVLAMDLDHFKAVNDTLGHSAGDDLLREVAARATASLAESLTASLAGSLTESLSGTTSPDALTVRLGGDEFAVLLPAWTQTKPCDWPSTCAAASAAPRRCWAPPSAPRSASASPPAPPQSTSRSTKPRPANPPPARSRPARFAPPQTGRPSPNSCCAKPTSRCTWPRPPAAGPASTTPPTTSTPPNASPP